MTKKKTTPPHGYEIAYTGDSVWTASHKGPSGWVRAFRTVQDAIDATHLHNEGRENYEIVDNVRVDRCSSCPFLREDYPFGCEHPNAVQGNSIENPPVPPVWCPLRVSPCLVQLAEDP